MTSSQGHLFLPESRSRNSLCCSDGKGPDGLTVIPWHGGKPLLWDVVSNLADLYISGTALWASAAAAAELALIRKAEKIRSPIVLHY